MMVRRMAVLLGVAMVSAAVSAQEVASEPTFVFLRPDTSSFWNTATGSRMTVPIDFPDGAETAELLVSGLGYNRAYENITKADLGEDHGFSVDLPEPTSPETEDVYVLTLTFDNGETKTARLGLLQGLSEVAEGSTRCLAPQTARSWQKVNGRAVLPIPYGTTSFTVNGVETDTGLGGAQGWYALDGLTFGNNASLVLTAGGLQYAASLLGGPSGFSVFIK